VAGRVQRRLGELARRLEREVARLEVPAGSLRPEDEADAEAMAEGQEPPGLEFYLLGAVEIYTEELRRLGAQMVDDVTMSAEELRRRWLADPGGGPPASGPG
jgi:hypothetical protein